MRKDISTAINYSKYLAFVLATVCVLIFQFTANSFCVNLALSLYVVAFGLMSASLVMHAEEVFEAIKIIKKQKLEQKNVETNEKGLQVSMDLKDKSDYYKRCLNK